MTRQSAKTLNRETKSRRGNHRLKNAMFLAAFALLRSPDSDSKTFDDPKRAVGKGHSGRPDNANHREAREMADAA